MLFTRFLRDLKARTFADKLPDGWVGLSTYLLDRVYLDHDTAWCDDIATLGIQEGPLGLLDSAAATAVGHSAGRTWGEIHFLAMQHPLASVPVVGTLLDLSFGPWPWGGTPGTLWASFYRQRGDSSCVSIVGPSLRFVVDFADPDAATLVLPAGNSGNPASPHFFDFFERYRTGEDWVVPFSREAVARSTVSTLTLAPAAVAGE